MTAREEIVKSVMADYILSRHIDRNYDNSRIACAYFEAVGRELDQLLVNIEDTGIQSVMLTASWGLDNWIDEYGIEIPPGTSLEEVRRALLEKKRRIVPASEYNLEQFLTMTLGRRAEIIQWTGPYKFDVCFIYDEEAGLTAGLSIHKAYELLKRSRPAHLCFGFTPAVKAGVKVKTEQMIFKFRNPLTGERGLRAGTYPNYLTFAEILKNTVVVEHVGKNGQYKNVRAGMRPYPQEELVREQALAELIADAHGYIYDPVLAGIFPYTDVLGRYEYRQIDIEALEREYFADIARAGEVNAGELPEEEDNNGLETEVEKITYEIATKYCGTYECGEDI